MDAKTGVGFLKLLFTQGLADKEDIEKSISIARSKSPSSAFDAGQSHFVARHGGAVMNGYLAFAKGTRWLAMIRRDSGQQAFEEAVKELRQLTGGIP